MNMDTVLNILLGWVIAQLTIWISRKDEQKSILKSLNSELYEILEDTDKNIKMLEHLIQRSKNGEIEGYIPFVLETYIFDYHFKEVAFKLNSSQRMSYKYIYSELSIARRDLEFISETLDKFHERSKKMDSKDQITESDIIFYRDKLIVCHEGFLSIKWMVSNHIKNYKNPDIKGRKKERSKYISSLKIRH